MLLLNKYIPINKMYIYITGLIAAFIFYKFVQASTTNGMKWNFFVNPTSSVLNIMYIIMFICILDKINKMAIFYL